MTQLGFSKFIYQPLRAFASLFPSNPPSWGLDEAGSKDSGPRGDHDTCQQSCYEPSYTGFYVDIYFDFSWVIAGSYGGSMIKILKGLQTAPFSFLFFFFLQNQEHLLEQNLTQLRRRKKGDEPGEKQENAKLKDDSLVVPSLFSPELGSST